jgi:hypothetical protein
MIIKRSWNLVFGRNQHHMGLEKVASQSRTSPEASKEKFTQVTVFGRGHSK